MAQVEQSIDLSKTSTSSLDQNIQSSEQTHQVNVLESSLKHLDVTASTLGSSYNNNYAAKIPCHCSIVCSKNASYCSSSSCRRRSWSIEMNISCGVLEITIVSGTKQAKQIHNSVKINQSYLLNHQAFENIIENPIDIYDYFHCSPDLFSFQNDVLSFVYKYSIQSCQDKRKQKVITIIIPKVYSIDITNINIEINSLKIQIENYITQINNLTIQINNYVSIVNNLQFKFGKFQGEFNGELSIINKLIIEINIKISAYIESINECKANIIDLYSKITIINNLIVILDGQTNKNTKDITQIFIEINIINERLCGFQGQVKDFDFRFQKITISIKEITIRIQKLQSDVKCLKQKTECLSEENNQINIRIDNLSVTYVTKEYLTIVINNLKKQLINSQTFQKYFKHMFLGQHHLNLHKKCFNFQFQGESSCRVTCKDGKLDEHSGKGKKLHQHFVFINNYLVTLPSVITYKIKVKIANGPIFIGCSTEKDIHDRGWEKGEKSNEAVFYGSKGQLLEYGELLEEKDKYSQNDTIQLKIDTREQVVQWTNLNNKITKRVQGWTQASLLNIVFHHIGDQVEIEVV